MQRTGSLESAINVPAATRAAVTPLAVVPLVIQGLAAILLAGVACRAAGLTPQLLGAVVLAAVTPRLVRIDVASHRLPNPLVVAAILAGVTSCAGEWIASGHLPLVPLVAGVAYAAFLAVLHLGGGMGMGDVKLALALGLASWNVTLAALSPVIAFLVGGLVAVVLLACGHRGRRIAFGPYLLGGYWVAAALVAIAKF